MKTADENRTTVMAEAGLRRRSDVSPERDPALDHLSLAELRVARQVLVDEVERVTFWRLAVRGRADRLRAGRSSTSITPHLLRALSDARRSPTRVAVVVEEDRSPAVLPDLAELCARELVPGDAVAVQALGRDLADAEASLTDYRRHLQDRVGGVTGELIARYRESPELALLLLPSSDVSPWTGSLALPERHRPFEPPRLLTDRDVIR
jgi:hypothetical protein